jgi:ABC-type nitrate/sulfonate/bicarbonate transport system substrate-binding protein
MTHRRIRTAVAAVAAAAFAVAGLAACSSSGSPAASSSSTAKAASGPLTTVNIQTAPGYVLPYIGYLAQELGYFKQNGINANFVTLTTGLSSTAALNAGSLNVIFADPTSTGPLIQQGTKLRLILNEQTIQWKVLVPKSTPKQPFATTVKSLKTVGAPAAAGGTAALLKLISDAYKLSPAITPVADQSGAGVVSGAEQGIIISPAGSCVLQNSGLKTAFDFAKPVESKSAYPAELSQLIGAPDIGYWVLDSYEQQNPKVVAGLQKALTETEAWANDPKNLDKWVQIMRGSPLNNTSLSDAQYKTCLSSVQGSFEPYFSEADAALWAKIGKIDGTLPNGLPPTSEWFSKGLPSQK